MSDWHVRDGTASDSSAAPDERLVSRRSGSRRMDDDASVPLRNSDDDDDHSDNGAAFDVPGLSDAQNDEELFAFLAGEAAASERDTSPRYLKWMPTFFPPCCLFISTVGAVFLFVLAALLASDYPYIRMSGDNPTHVSTLNWAAVLYIGLAAASVACMWAQRPAPPRSTVPRGRF